MALLGVHGELRPPGWSIWILHITIMSKTIRKPFTHFSTLTRGFYPRPRTGRRDTIREDFKKLSAFLRIGCVDIVISIHSIPCLRSSIMFALSLEDTNALKLSNFECECCSLGKVTVLFDKHKRTRRVALRVRHRDCQPECRATATDRHWHAAVGNFKLNLPVNVYFSYTSNLDCLFLPSSATNTMNIDLTGFFECIYSIYESFSFALRFRTSRLVQKISLFHPVYPSEAVFVKIEISASKTTDGKGHSRNGLLLGK